MRGPVVGLWKDGEHGCSNNMLIVGHHFSWSRDFPDFL